VSSQHISTGSWHLKRIHDRGRLRLVHASSSCCLHLVWPSGSSRPSFLRSRNVSLPTGQSAMSVQPGSCTIAVVPMFRTTGARGLSCERCRVKTVPAAAVRLTCIAFRYRQSDRRTDGGRPARRALAASNGHRGESANEGGSQVPTQCPLVFPLQRVKCWKVTHGEAPRSGPQHSLHWPIVEVMLRPTRHP
jgi:hypothetical protein